MTSVLALVIAVPVSIGIALFLTDIAPRWLRGPIGIAIELLAAIPSIIYGMWGLFVFAPFMAVNVEPWMNDHLGKLARDWGNLLWTADRDRSSYGLDRAGHHDHPLYFRRFA